MEKKISERLVVFLVGAVQFVNVLDFVMVMPMGPDFARALGIPQSEVGIIGGSYTAAAAISGFAGSFFLDRFDRRKALLVAMLGLVAGTAMGGLATGLPSLIAARVIAGLFGGPATSVSLSIIADVVPGERRGKALGAVMGAFSFASVLGIPAALKASEWFGWRAPFIGVAALGLFITLAAVFFLPSLTGHLAMVKAQAGHRWEMMGRLFTRPVVILSYLMTTTVMMAGFIIIPSISGYVQYNLGYPREGLGGLYFVGGIVSFFAMRGVGFLVDRFGSFPIGTIGSGMLMGVLYVGFVRYIPGFPVVGIYIGFMLCMSFRNVSYNTLASKVPSPAERAQFMSIQSAVQHIASAIGAVLSSHILLEAPDKSLIGMDKVAFVSMALNMLLPVLLWQVEARVKGQGAPAVVPAVAAAPAVAVNPAPPH
jgi:predicted MFS family arabinose efflux permease